MKRKPSLAESENGGSAFPEQHVGVTRESLQVLFLKRAFSNSEALLYLRTQKMCYTGHQVNI